MSLLSILSNAVFMLLAAQDPIAGGQGSPVPHPSDSNSQVDVEQCLRHFEGLFHGKSVLFHPDFADDAFAGQEFSFAMDEDGGFVATRWNFPASQLETWSCRTADGLFLFASRHQSGHLTVNGLPESGAHGLAGVHFVGCLAGLSCEDSCLYSQILTQADSSLDIVPESSSAGIQFRATVQNPRLGTYTFWIAGDGDPRIVRIETFKKAGHLLFETPNSSPVPLGAPVRAGRFQSPAEQARADTEAAKQPRETWRKRILFPVLYHDGPDGTWPSEIGVRVTSGASDGGEHEYTVRLVVDRATRFRPRDPHRAEFLGLEIPEGSPVGVYGREGIPFELRGGVIAQVIDAESVARANGVRFRKPQSRWRYYAGLLAGGAVFAALLIFRRIRRTR